MAKDTKQKLAKELYLGQDKTPDRIAHQLNITRRTVDRWIKELHWKKLRDAKANGSKQRMERTQLVIDSLTDERLHILQELKNLQDKAETTPDKKSIQEQITGLRKQATAIDDGIAKWNKRIEHLDKEHKITLSVYLEVMSSIFEDLRQHHEALYLKTLDFQEAHLDYVSEKLNA